MKKYPKEVTELIALKDSHILKLQRENKHLIFVQSESDRRITDLAQQLNQKLHEAQAMTDKIGVLEFQLKISDGQIQELRLVRELIRGILELPDAKRVPLNFEKYRVAELTNELTAVPTNRL